MSTSAPDTLRLHSLAWPVQSLGPGRRLALWVGGCPLRCHGCLTPELQPADAGHRVRPERLSAYVAALPLPLDGLTISGGEPFAQAPVLAGWLQALRPLRPHWDVLIYSGYPWRTLQRTPAAQDLLACTDLLGAGPYRSALPSRQPGLGSGNQRWIALTARGQTLLDRWHDQPAPAAEYGLATQRTDRRLGVPSRPTGDARSR